MIEGDSPPRIACTGNAYPPLQYQWFRNGTVKSEGPILHIYKPMTRDDAGVYECVSRNKHGTKNASIEINILCRFCILSPMMISFTFWENNVLVICYLCADKPDCTITRREINDEDTLVCTANGNPAKVNIRNGCYIFHLACISTDETADAFA